MNEEITKALAASIGPPMRETWVERLFKNQNEKEYPRITFLLVEAGRIICHIALRPRPKIKQNPKKFYYGSLAKFWKPS